MIEVMTENTLKIQASLVQLPGTPGTQFPSSSTAAKPIVVLPACTSSKFLLATNTALQFPPQRPNGFKYGYEGVATTTKKT